MDGGPRPGRVIGGRYELEELIGRGGVGEVWRARHLALNAPAAIKFLRGSEAASGPPDYSRFTTEAQISARLRTRHAVQVFDFGVTEDGHPYLVMELLEGETLGERIEQKGRLDLLEAAHLLGQSSRALHRAHQLGIVHRDFKPDNVFITVDDEGKDYVKVVDFGIARLIREPAPVGEDDDTLLAATIPTTTFTRTGSVVGTPYYMAPEQVRSAAHVDLHADIWAFGVVAFECLTGQPPFDGENLLELFARIQNGAHRIATRIRPELPPRFDDWFRRACALDPADRFTGATAAWKELVDALGCGSIDLDPSRGFRTAPSGDSREHIARLLSGSLPPVPMPLDSRPSLPEEPPRPLTSEPPPLSLSLGRIATRASLESTVSLLGPQTAPRRARASLVWLLAIVAVGCAVWLASRQTFGPRDVAHRPPLPEVSPPPLLAPAASAFPATANAAPPPTGVLPALTAAPSPLASPSKPRRPPARPSLNAPSSPEASPSASAVPAGTPAPEKRVGPLEERF